MNRGEELFGRLEEGLLRIERRLQFLGRMTPLNFEELVEKASTKALGFSSVLPVYAKSEGLRELRVELAAIETVLSGAKTLPLGLLLFERVRELALEFELVERRGETVVRSLASDLYPVSREEELEAERVAECWLTEPLTVADDEDVLLAGVLEEELRRRKLSVSVREVPLMSRAAVGDGLILVRRGCRVGRRMARRIAVHEILGHLLPRQAASEPPYRVGPKGAAMDEEGRAVLLEERFELWDSERRRELALRFRFAAEVRRGAELGDLLRLGGQLGVSEKTSAELAWRCLRGGGLAREIVYLVGYLRVRTAFAEAPHLEGYFEKGKMSLLGARRLHEGGFNSRTTGA